MSLENNSCQNVSPFSIRRMVTLFTKIGYTEGRAGLGEDCGEFGGKGKYFNTSGKRYE